MARFLRACLALLLFLVSFADGKEREEYVQLAWSTIMKILTCLILCSVADVAKTLLAKLLSSHFHKRAHFDKMQDALNKVNILPGFGRGKHVRECGLKQNCPSNSKVQFVGSTPVVSCCVLGLTELQLRVESCCLRMDLSH